MSKPDGPVMHKKDWRVLPVDIATARALVETYHYARHASNTAVALHGLFPVIADQPDPTTCYGCAWWIPPTRTAAEATVKLFGDYPDLWKHVLSLSRLVVHPDMPTNAASFLLGRSMRLLDRKRWPILVTYADTWQGHDGGIYKATNWLCVGMTSPERVFLKDGVMLARKRGQITRTNAEMEALGAVNIGAYPKYKYIHVARS